MKRLAFLFVFGVSACSFGPSKEDIDGQYVEASPPGEGEAVVYLFRGRGHSIMNVTFTLNETKVVSLGNDEYSWVTVSPGTYNFEVAEPMTRSLGMSLDVEGGQVYYVGYNIEYSDGGASLVVRRYEKQEADGYLDRSDYKKAARRPSAQGTESFAR